MAELDEFLGTLCIAQANLDDLNDRSMFTDPGIDLALVIGFENHDDSRFCNRPAANFDSLQNDAQ